MRIERLLVREHTLRVRIARLHIWSWREVWLKSFRLIAVGRAGAGLLPSVQTKLFDLLQFGADPQSRWLKRNAVTCAFVSREGRSTRRVLSKLQQIEKFLR